MGGITYRNGELTVPSDGIYYIYASLYMSPVSTGYVRLSLAINGTPRISALDGIHTSNFMDRTKYIGILRQLKRGDRVSVIGTGHRFIQYSEYTTFGVWKLN